jgi:hypothetical protein
MLEVGGGIVPLDGLSAARTLVPETAKKEDKKKGTNQQGELPGLPSSYQCTQRQQSGSAAHLYYSAVRVRERTNSRCRTVGREQRLAPLFLFVFASRVPGVSCRHAYACTCYSPATSKLHTYLSTYATYEMVPQEDHRLSTGPLTPSLGVPTHSLSFLNRPTKILGFSA